MNANWQVIPGQVPAQLEVAWAFETEEEADASLRGHADLGVWAEKRRLRGRVDHWQLEERWCVITKVGE